MAKRQNDAGVWRAEGRGSILGRMRQIGQAPHGPARMHGRDAEHSSAPDETAEEIRIFLVADVRGYTVFTQERGDEAAARLAATFADIVREHVQARDGSVIELRGDEALAVFRSPRQAIRAAVELQAGLLQATRAAPDLPLPVGIGLDAGEAVPVESGFRGGALNLAARLCSEAGAGEILGSQNLVHLARTVEGVRYAGSRRAALQGALRSRPRPGDRFRRGRRGGADPSAPPHEAGASRVRRQDAVPRPRAARGGRGRRPHPPRRAEAASGPGASPRAREPARASRHPCRRDLGRRAARAGPERHPDLCLAPPEGPRPRPDPEPSTRLPPEARSLRAGRDAVRRRS